MLRQATVENGVLQGVRSGDPRITVYRGVPFAAPPVGDLRWRAPRPARDWEGVYKADTFAPIPMQEPPGLDPDNFYSFELHPATDLEMSEDCLYLNVWTPAKSADEKLPVMVWIHGGAYHSGYSYEMEFDGDAIGRRGVILVTLAYRLGAFGFFAHPEITAEDPNAIPTNFGLLDQKAGIEWVKRNIAAFGGDPDNITIFGQSAGAGSVAAHLASPLTEGLFQRAIVESGGGLLNRPGDTPTLADAEEIGKALFESLGVASLAEARRLDAQTVQAASREGRVNMVWRPVVDGKYVVEPPMDAIRRDRNHEVSLMIGHTANEFLFGPKATTLAEFEAWAREHFGHHADRYVALCASESGDVAEMCAKGMFNASEAGDLIWCETNVALGRGPIYCYSFDHDIPGDDNPGAYHSSDLWFEFGTVSRCWRPFVGKHYDLSRLVVNYWTSFARGGDPNGPDADGTPMPEWAPYTADSPRVLRFGDTTGMDSGERRPLVRLLMELGL